MRPKFTYNNSGVCKTTYIILQFISMVWSLYLSVPGRHPARLSAGPYCSVTLYTRRCHLCKPN